MTSAGRYDLRDRIAELEAEVEYLRGQLGIRNEMIPTLCKALKIAPRSAEVLAMLYAGGGRWVLRNTIETELLEVHPLSERMHGAVSVYICLLRKQLGFESIDTDGVGRHGAAKLTRAGMERVIAALSALEPSQA